MEPPFVQHCLSFVPYTSTSNIGDGELFACFDLPYVVKRFHPDGRIICIVDIRDTGMVESRRKPKDVPAPVVRGIYGEYSAIQFRK